VALSKNLLEKARVQKKDKKKKAAAAVARAARYHAVPRATTTQSRS